MAGSSSNSSQNVSSGSSQSQSTTGVLDYPERAFLDSVAQYTGQVGQNIYNWAQGEYAKNSNLTDANIHNYLNTSQSALNNANAYQNEYNNNAIPGINQQFAEARNYASPDRISRDMGAAISGQQQGNEAALNAHKQDLQSYGIDPSAGRYAGLDEASKVQSAAAAVGSAEAARRADVTTGQSLLNNAIGNSQPLLGATINAQNTALQGFAGSENAELANANTGVSLQQAANPSLATAASYKPVVGTNSTSSSSNQSQGSSQGSSQTSDPAAQPKDQSQPQQQATGDGYTGSGGGGFTSGSGGSSSSGSTGGGDTGSFTDGTNGDGSSISGTYDTSGNDPTQQDFTDSGGTYSGDNFSYDTSGGNTYGFDSSGNMDSGGSGSDFSGTDFGGGGGNADGGFAEGGAIPDDGGPVPTSASPSGGQNVDDVQAQLPSGKGINVNADEFVIPRDVALWKGQEFFQKLIDQSRKARVTAPAHPSQGMGPQQ